MNEYSDYNYDSLQYYSDPSKAPMFDPATAMIISIVLLVIAVVIIVSMWKLFSKADKPGWAAIVPFYNAWVMAEVGGKPGWWGLGAMLLAFIPIVGGILSLIVFVIITHGISRNFGKDIGTTVLLLLVPFVGFPMLAFGEAKYKPVVAAAGTSPAPKTKK